MDVVKEPAKYEEIKPLLRIAARQHFWAFVCYMDYEFFQSRKFLKEPAIAIQLLLNRKYKKIGISMPPRAGKSYLGTLAAVYGIATQPEGAVMRNCNTYGLYKKFSYAARSVIKSPKFQEVFPEIQLAPDRQEVKNWSITKATGSSFFGNGVGGSIIGDGANILSITDDLYSGHGEAMSDNYQETLSLWNQSERQSRLEGDCPELDIGTRWTKDDFIGKRVEAGEYDQYFVIPALDENGKSFCEAVKSTEAYLKMKKETDPFVWESEFMQQPIDAEGLVFPLGALKRFGKVNEGGIKIAYIDTADEGEDYLSMPFIKFFTGSNQGYLDKVIFNRNNLTQNEPLIVAAIQNYQPDYVMVETNKEGSFFLNSLRKQCPNTPFYAQFNSTNKLTRILAQSGWITEHIQFKKDHEDDLEYNRFMVNLTKYLRTGTVKNDDAPDSLAGLASFTRKLLKL